MPLTFPNFKYYMPRKNKIQLAPDGGLYVSENIPKSRYMHGHILQAAILLLKSDPATPKQRWANAMLWTWYNYMPEYFFNAPASATGKYHPEWANRPDGLLLHSLAVCRVTASLSDLFDLNNDDYNRLIFAAWHHDMFKYGELDDYTDGDMTVHEHPVYAGEFFTLPHVTAQLKRLYITQDDCDEIAAMISQHAGPYRSSKFSAFKLPECTDPLAKILYKADYIASRREDGWIQDQLQIIPMRED